MLRLIKKLIPGKLFKLLQPYYHWMISFAAAIIYRFPSRKIFVIGLVGTKGKTSTVEIINAIMEEAGYKTALSSSLRFKIDKDSEKNEFKMTMPGRFFLQRFLRRSVKAGCQYAILEITSEGAVLHRHKFIQLNALIFTNLAPEHIESHGSFENYRDAKLSIFKALEKSSSKNLLDSRRGKIIIVNEDDPNAHHFLNFNIPEKIKYSIKNASHYELLRDGIDFAVDGANIHSKLSGEFNLYNILAAIAFAKSQNIGMDTIKTAIEKFSGIDGRLENIELPINDTDRSLQDFKVIVDYAHTPDSLEKVYEVFQSSRRICVLGSAGGGRDKWKRKEMGKIASKHCDQIILTNEDPYDEDPLAIIKDIEEGITRGHETVIDRREAISRAISYAKTGDTVIITGKGAEPWMMLAKGAKLKWDDREVAREELKKVLEGRK